MTVWLFLPAILVLFVCFLLWRSLVVVQEETVIVIERLGRFHRLLRAGVHATLPLVERRKTIVWTGGQPKRRYGLVIRHLDLREQIVYADPRPVITRDNITLTINPIVYWRIVDPRRAVYETGDLIDAILTTTVSSLRNVVGELELDEVLFSREHINQTVLTALTGLAPGWGIEVSRVEMVELAPPDDIRAAMEKQMRAERERRARVIEAEGRKQAAILDAEGEKESALRRAEAESLATVEEAQARKEADILDAEAKRRVWLLEAKTQGEIRRLEAEAAREADRIARESAGELARMAAASRHEVSLAEVRTDAQVSDVRADARRRAEVLRARGEAAAIQSVYDALRQAAPGREALAIKYLEMMQSIADGQANKVYIPYDGAGGWGLMEQLREMWNPGDSPSVDGGQ
jgi:regulator of protease activity HflC (stomatin/prohibitin superfamily)